MTLQVTFPASSLAISHTSENAESIIYDMFVSNGPRLDPQPQRPAFPPSHLCGYLYMAGTRMGEASLGLHPGVVGPPIRHFTKRVGYSVSQLNIDSGLS